MDKRASASPAATPERRAEDAADGRADQGAAAVDPTSIVVPQVARLQLTPSGSPAPNGLTPSQPSGLGTIVTVLHDCNRPSVLRFQTVVETPDLLDVEELDEDFPSGEGPSTPTPSDGGGLARAPICS